MQIHFWILLFLAFIVIPGLNAPGLEDGIKLDPSLVSVTVRGNQSIIYIAGKPYTMNSSVALVWGDVYSAEDITMPRKNRWRLGLGSRGKSASMAIFISQRQAGLQPLPQTSSAKTAARTPASRNPIPNPRNQTQTQSTATSSSDTLNDNHSEYVCPINDPIQEQITKPGEFSAVVYTEEPTADDVFMGTGYVRILKGDSNEVVGIVPPEVANSLLALEVGNAKLQELGKLQLDHEKLKSDCSRLGKDNQFMLGQRGVLENEKKELEKKVSKSTEDNQRIVELEARIKNLEGFEEKFKQTKLDSEEVASLNKTLEARVKELDAQKKTLEGQAKKDTKKIGEVNTEIERLKKIIKDLGDEAKKTATANSHQVDNITAEKARLESTNIKLEAKIKEIEGNIAEVEKQKKALKSEAGKKENAEKRAAELAKEITSLNEALKVVESKLEQSNKTATAASKTNTELVEKQKALEKELGIAKLDAKDLKQVSDGFKTDIAKLNETVKKLQSDKAVIEEESDRRIKELMAETEVLKRLKEEMASMKNELHQTRQELESVKAELKGTKVELAQANKREQTALAENKKLQGKLTLAEQRIQYLERQLKEVSEERRKLQDEKNATMEDHDNAVRRNNKLMGEIESLKKKLAETETMKAEIERILKDKQVFSDREKDDAARLARENLEKKVAEMETTQKAKVVTLTDQHAIKLALIETKYEKAKTDAKNANETSASEAARLKEVEAEKARFEKQLEERTLEHSKALNKIQTLQNDFSQLESAHKAKVQELEKDQKDNKKTIETHYQEMEALKKEYKSSWEKLEKEKKETRVDIFIKIDRRHNEDIAAIQRLNKEVDQLKKTNTNLEKLSKDGAKRLKDAEKVHANEKKELEGYLNDKNDQVKGLEDELEKLRKDYETQLKAKTNGKTNPKEVLKISAELWRTYRDRFLYKEGELMALRLTISKYLSDILDLRIKLAELQDLYVCTETCVQTVGSNYTDAMPDITALEKYTQDLERQLAYSKTCWGMYENIRETLGKVAKRILPVRLITVYNAMSKGLIKGIKPITMFFTFATALYYTSHALNSPEAATATRPFLPPVPVGPFAPQPGAVPAANSFITQLIARWYGH